MTDQHATVLVTGATSGLGFAVAQALASSGHHVIVGARSAAKAEAAIARMLADPDFDIDAAALSAVVLDLADDESIVAAADAVRERFGALDILINSAGVGGDDSQVSLRAELRSVFDTNVFGAAVLIETFLPLLRASTYHDRRFVNVTSGAGQIGLALSDDERFNALAITAPAYRMSKAALNMLTAIHAMLLREDGIACVVAAPGPTSTPFNDHRGDKDVHDGARPILRAATDGDPQQISGTLVADESTEHGW